MPRRDRRFSASPLIDPTLSSVLLIAPTPQDLASVARHIRKGLHLNLAAIVAATQITDVPLFLSSPGPEPSKHGFRRHFPRTSRHREFMAGEHALPWHSAGFTEALSRADRSVFVIGGLWLEHQVLATALHALADSYDVYVLVDAAPARARSVALLSQDRLVQAGATPVATSQVIHEWSVHMTDATKRSALSALLAPTSSTGSK